MEYFVLLFTIFDLMQSNGFKCIAKEADLTCELLRRGASYD
jgi:hypothetical protein